MPAPSCTSPLLQYAPVITWVLVIGGWLLVNYQQNSRETRKEIRTRIDTIQGHLKSLEKSAIEYHTDKPITENARRIKIEIKQVVFAVNQLSTPLEVKFIFELFQLRQTITLRHFDESGIEPIGLSHEIIDNIGESVERLASSLEQSYAKRYYKKWYQLLA